MNLEETTDREGFKDTPYYRNFYLLLTEFVKYSGKIQDCLRRSWNEFRKGYQESISGIEAKDTISDMTKTIRNALAEAPNHQKSIYVFKEQITKTETVSAKITETLKRKKEISSGLREQTVDLLNQFKPVLNESKKILNHMGEYLSELNSLKSLPNIIDRRIEDLHEQMEIMYESMALGLTAEALVHEINNIADHLTIRSKAIKVDLAKRNIIDRNMLEYIEYVYSAIIALQKQMSFLSPTLRFVREKRSIIVVDDFLNEINDYFKEKWENDPISINISNITNEPFTIKVNKGKIIQIVDNIILNSEYWLKEDMRQNKLIKGIIGIDISIPYIYISDNGRGVDPNVETTLFEPFVTTKAKGRGLGLFIVKQLLASEDCNIELLAERNKKKRLYKFQLDLRGIIYE
jgi:C4-dicarboxylate-specific signal transduction histidine kinase